MTTESGLSIETEYVLDATGRKPNVQEIGLENVNIEFSDKGIKVDDYLRTNVKNIYASGDVIDKTIPKLTPTATFESNYIAAHILGLDQNAIQYQQFLQYYIHCQDCLKLVVTVMRVRKQKSDDYTVKRYSVW